MNILARILRRWWAVILIILTWQLAVIVLDVSPFLLPGPFTIIANVADSPGTFLVPLLMTLRTALIGFVVGVGTGYLAASLTWLWPIFGTVITPVALVIRSVPFVALIPILATILGYSLTTAWVICAMVCFFPTFVMVGSGLSDVPANGDDLFTVAGATRWMRYRLLAVPSSLVALATSIRVSAAAAFTAALISEFLMGVPGLAVVLNNALAGLDMTDLWGTALCAILIGVLAYLGANRLEAYAISRWS
ncbi:ABC transporter permease subunit [Microbacterium sp. Au-Mic1]|uniref:ABC transporter permease n=1 Tax=Microbacterium sp. Au-Mic1 TaxID=2906457 RepID=UPI001E65CC69|nr:ABC transporter permease subunit [Microbacterium sp. Au-Mic1]MCE4025504.1 ABC transporter permease subunit [Microbacterium sp. Au-Mic1]